MRKVLYIIGLIVSFSAGWWVADQSAFVARATEEKTPAYMIISVNEIHPDKLGPFKKAVRPIVQSVGGAELLAISQKDDVQLLEGEWNFPGLLLIEKFESMEAVKSYWYSDEYQEVKKLREGYAEANFFIAIEGRPHGL